MVFILAAEGDVVSNIVLTTIFLQNCAKGWKEADSAWEDFHMEVKHLQIRHKHWLKQFQRHGLTTMLAVGELRHNVDAACKLLEDKKAKLWKRGEQ